MMLQAIVTIIYTMDTYARFLHVTSSYDTQLGMVTMGVRARAQCLLCLSSNIMGPPLTLLGSYTCVANACRVCGVFSTFLCRVG